MTIKESFDFSFAGEQSINYGLHNVNLDEGMQEEPFLAGRSIQEVKIRGRDEPYLQYVEKEPFEFNVSFYFKDTWDDDKIRSVARWLCRDTYQPLFFTSNISRIFHCMVVDSPKLIHNGLKQGYLEIKFRCNSPYSYTGYREDIYDLSLNVIDGTAIVFANIGDIVCKPKLTILKYGAGDFSIINYTDGGKEFKFVDLADNEEIYVDSENQIIETNIEGIYRYDNFNFNFLEMLYGNNQLKVFGNAEIKFEYRYKLLA